MSSTSTIASPQIRVTSEIALALAGLHLRSLPDDDLYTGEEDPGLSVNESELPSYSPRDGPPNRRHTTSSQAAFIEHSYSLTNRSKRPWATLKLKSRARAPTHRPYFFEGDPVEGSVDLSLERPESIRLVEVEVTGVLSTGATETYTFLHLPQTLWSKTDSPSEIDSLASAPASDEPYPVSTSTSSGALFGSYSFPFSFSLPAEVEITGKFDKKSSLHRIPGTFVEKNGGDLFIQYDLVCHIRRTKFKVDSKLRSVFGYTPLFAPSLPSPLRQLAYQEDSALLGPSADPEGWLTLPPFIISGTLFGTRSVDVQCTLSIAQPLAYTRNAPIPLSLKLQSSDEQALDMISAPASTPSIRLMRHVSNTPASAAKVKAGYFDTTGRSKPQKSTRGKARPMGSTDWNVVTSVVEGAVFWPNTEGNASEMPPDVRVLDGEIFLAPDLKPSTDLGHFDLWYTVVAYPPISAPGFVPTDTDSLASQPVSIATAFSLGPRPRLRAPPGYMSATAREDGFTGVLTAHGRFRRGQW